MTRPFRQVCAAAADGKEQLRKLSNYDNILLSESASSSGTSHDEWKSLLSLRLRCVLPCHSRDGVAMNVMLLAEEFGGLYAGLPAAFSMRLVSSTARYSLERISWQRLI